MKDRTHEREHERDRYIEEREQASNNIYIYIVAVYDKQRYACHTQQSSFFQIVNVLVPYLSLYFLSVN